MRAKQFPVSAKPSRLLGRPACELKFRVQGGEHHGRILRITASKCSIGSAVGCTLRLRGENIEPLHCLILMGKNGTIVRRNSSRTYLNGGPFEDAALHVGDILRFGPVELAVADCPQGACSSSPSQASAPVDASDFERAATIEQRIAEEVNRARDEERGEQQRLTLELDQVKEQLRKVHAQLTNAQQIHEPAVLENQQVADDQQSILQLQEELRTQRNQRQQEQAEAVTTQSELESALTLLQVDVAAQRSQISSMQQAGRSTAQRIRQLETQLDEARQLEKQGQEHELAERQQLQEEFAAVRNRLEFSIVSLTEQLQKREAELAAAHERGGEFAGTLRMRLEEQLADLTAKLVERDEALNHRDLELAELRPQGVQLLAAQQTVRELESLQGTANAARQAEREAWQAERCMLESQKCELETVRCQLEAQCGCVERQRTETETQLRELHAQHDELQGRFANLAAQCGSLQSQCGSLETRRVELESQVSLAQETARRCEELEAQLADLRSRSEQAVAQEQTIHPYEEQVERWQSEAHNWQLQAEEVTAQLAKMRECCANLEAQNAELQTAIHAAGAANSQQQTYEYSRVQQEIQGTDLAEARAQLREEQAQLANLLAEISAREETLLRLETELREREAAWENSRGVQAAALDDRSQRIAAQIAQFEAEQAAFARQQATIIRQMSSLEDRVQELTTASESRSFHAYLGSTQAEAPVLQSDRASAEQTNDREVSSGADEVSTREDSERPETRPEVDVADSAPMQSGSELSTAERDLGVQRLMLAIESMAGDGESLVSASMQANESATEKTPYTAPSLLDQAAEMARQEVLVDATVPPVDHKSSSNSHAANQTNDIRSPASSNDEDDSIEQYMNRLLSRVRGGNSTAESAVDIPRPQPAPLPVSFPVASVESPVEPEEYVPRILAPEPPERLSQMRELANTAANSAIHAHAQKSQKRAIKDRSLIALISLVGATSLFIAGCFTGSKIAIVGSMGFVTACCFMGLRALVAGYWQLRRKPLAEAARKQGDENIAQTSVQK